MDIIRSQCYIYRVKDYLNYDDVKIFKYENLFLAIIYTIGHIIIAMICNRLITGTSLDMAVADALIEPIINGFWFYFLMVYFKNIVIEKIESNNLTFINLNQIGFLLAVIYTIGHILIAMTCNNLITGAPLNLAIIDAFVEPLVNGFWFYILFEIVRKYKYKKSLGSVKQL